MFGWSSQREASAVSWARGQHADVTAGGIHHGVAVLGTDGCVQAIDVDSRMAANVISRAVPSTTCSGWRGDVE